MVKLPIMYVVPCNFRISYLRFPMVTFLTCDLLAVPFVTLVPVTPLKPLMSIMISCAMLCHGTA